jgi:endonuclease/exonuclease/phosphatase family metal-dependent hydrolase
MGNIRVITHNVKMLPGPFGRGDRDLDRARKLVEALGTTYDVVCLQEVFDEEAREVFDRAFLQAGYQTVPKVDDGDIGQEDSGLFFATKLMIAVRAYEEYEDSAGTDSLADKGIFGAQLVHEEGWLFVFNTHLQATLSEYDVRLKQLKQLRKFAKRMMVSAAHAKRSAMLLGDFNVVGETHEHAVMLSALGYPRDTYRALHADEGYTWDRTENTNMIPEDDHDKQRLDYVLTWDSIPTGSDDVVGAPLRPLQASNAEVVRFGEIHSRLSDHFGVCATIATL